MQDFDPGAFDKPQLDQPPLELAGREAIVIVLDANRPYPSGHSDCGSAKRHGDLRFTSRNARVLTRVSPSYCDSLSVASQPSHSWYRMQADAGDAASDKDRLRLHFRQRGTLPRHLQSEWLPSPTVNCNFRLCQESRAAASAASLQRDSS